MAVHTTYQFLEPRRRSHYQQLFVRGRNLRAESLYRATLGPAPRTPEEVAADFGLPLAAVHEAVHYCLHNDEVLQREREEVVAEIRRRGLDKPPYVPMQGVVDMLCLPQDIALREGGIRGDRTCLGPGSMTPIRAE